MLNLKKLFSTGIVIQFIFYSNVVLTAELQSLKSELNLQEVTLPSEVKDLNKQSGSIYYNTSVKNKVLIPAHIWGEVSKPGLHFIPTDTTLIKGISMAGGPSGAAKLQEIILTRVASDGQFKQYEFNLSGGGDADAYKFKLEPGDSIFIKKDTFYENRAYYTGLIGISISILSTILLLRKIK